MFKKETQDGMRSLLDEGVELVGEISFSHELWVNGVVKGKLQSEDSLVVMPKGKVNAEATLRRISVKGEFQGTIIASERVEIHKDGKVYGDIFTPCLIIEAGAIFEGKCNMSERKADKTDGAALLKVVETKPETPAKQQAAGTDIV